MLYDYDLPQAIQQDHPKRRYRALRGVGLRRYLVDRYAATHDQGAESGREFHGDQPPDQAAGRRDRIDLEIFRNRECDHFERQLFHLGIYHSKFPDAERVEIWRKQLGENGYDIILGVRSSIFLPFRNLGLVIVDEEHENTYKQQDPAPRYHARSAAIVLAAMYGAKTLLGTATPSIESWQNAREGKYGFVQLKERYKEILIDPCPQKEAFQLYVAPSKTRKK